MKTIELEQAGQQISEALKNQGRNDPIVLTEGSEALGLLLRLPHGTKAVDVDWDYWPEAHMIGHIVIVVGAKRDTHGSATGNRRPVFGSCQGMMTIVSEDDEYLKDFEEYME